MFLKVKPNENVRPRSTSQLEIFSHILVTISISSQGFLCVTTTLAKRNKALELVGPGATSNQEQPFLISPTCRIRDSYNGDYTTGWMPR